MAKRKELHEVLVIDDNDGQQRKGKVVKHLQPRTLPSKTRNSTSYAISETTLTPSKISIDSGSLSSRQDVQQTSSPHELRYSSWTFPSQPLASSVPHKPRLDHHDVIVNPPSTEENNTPAFSYDVKSNKRQITTPQMVSIESNSFQSRQDAQRTSFPHELRHSSSAFPSRTLVPGRSDAASRTESISLVTHTTRSESPDTIVGDINDGLETIEIDDDDYPTLQEVSMPREYWDLTRETPDVHSFSGKPNDFQDDDYMDSDEFNEWAAQITKERTIRTSRRLTESSQQMVVVRPKRNDCIVLPLVLLDEISYNGITIRPKVTVELQNGSFMRVAYVIQDVSSGDVFLRGLLFGRTKELNGWLEKKLNELCMLVQVDQDDERPYEEQSMEDVIVTTVVRRRHLRLTNRPFPELSFRKDQKDGKEEVKNERVLVCRWRFIRYYTDAKARVKDSPCELALFRLRREECDPQHAIDDDFLRLRWRGATKAGGSYVATERKDFRSHVALSDPDIILVEHHNNAIKTKISQQKLASDTHGERRKRSQQGRIFSSTERKQRRISSLASIDKNRPGNRQAYTFGDGFCGAGGTSRGATSAGFHVCWGFDMDPHACESWGLNWPAAQIFQMMANDFAMHPLINALVDILHLSPPCQYFSPAHTTAGPNDEKNTASSFATSSLLDKARPRIVTIENTHGLLQRHSDYMSGTIHQFTSKGFSIRWKILNFADFGLPQKRQRLAIIASCAYSPGEVLPTYPQPTHSKTPEQTGLKPWMTINQAIGNIPQGTPNHDLVTVRRFSDKPSFDGNVLSNTMTTSGGGYHPSGLRAYTNREIACLQGFPLNHIFGRHHVRHQIGNAVPPSVARKLLRHIRQALLKADGIVEQPEELISV